MPDTPDTVKIEQAVEKSASSEEDFKALFARSPIAKIRYDAQGYPIKLNDAAVALIGVADVTAIAHFSLFSTPRISDADKERLRGGEAIRYEQRYDFDDIKLGGHFPTTRSGVSYLDAHIIALFAETGVVKEYVGEFVDISERERAEEERASIAKFPEENPNPILRLTPDGVVLFANEASRTLLHDRSSFSANPFDQVRARAADAYRSEKTCTLDVTLGTKALLLTFVPLTDNGYVNVYGTDMTAQKRTEEALQNAERLAGIGETAAMIGHDLRNPLQCIHYIVDLQKLRFERVPPVMRDADDWKQEEELFDRISEQVFYMDKIVADLQDYARPITPEPKMVQSAPLSTTSLCHSLTPTM